jgi:hypothetical protein
LLLVGSGSGSVTIFLDPDPKLCGKWDPDPKKIVTDPQHYGQRRIPFEFLYILNNSFSEGNNCMASAHWKQSSSLNMRVSSGKAILNCKKIND